MAKKKDDKKSEKSERAKVEKAPEETPGKISRKRFDKELEKLQVELCRIQTGRRHNA